MCGGGGVDALRGLAAWGQGAGTQGEEVRQGRVDRMEIAVECGGANEQTVVCGY